MTTLKRVMGLPSDPIVLLVDDDSLYQESLIRLLSRERLRLVTAVSGLHALDVLGNLSEHVHVVVSDYWMHGMDGVRLLTEIERLYPKTRRVLLTGAPDSEIVLEAKSLHRVLTKSMGDGMIRQGILREVQRYG